MYRDSLGEQKLRILWEMSTLWLDLWLGQTELGKSAEALFYFQVYHTSIHYFPIGWTRIKIYEDTEDEFRVSMLDKIHALRVILIGLRLYFISL